jgi:hypothetical protein
MKIAKIAMDEAMKAAEQRNELAKIIASNDD